MADSFFRAPVMPSERTGRQDHERFLLDTYAERRVSDTPRGAAWVRAVLARAMRLQ